MKYWLFLIGVVCVLSGILGFFLIGPTREKSILDFWLNLNQSLSLFAIGNLSLGIYYLSKESKSIKWHAAILLLLIVITFLWFGGLFRI